MTDTNPDEIYALLRGMEGARIDFLTSIDRVFVALGDDSQARTEGDYRKAKARAALALARAITEGWTPQ